MKTSAAARWVRPFGYAFILAFAAGSANGAGFAIIEQGVSGLGNAFAGGSAVAEDPTTVFFNPAGMTRLAGNQVALAGHVIVPQGEFDNKGSTDWTGSPLTGGDGGDAAKTAFVPNAYYTVRLQDGLAFGVGMSAPFGLETDYKRDWVGRYHAVKSDLVSININPSLAFKMTDHVSFGLGFNAQYVDAELSNAIDFGGIIDFQTLAAGGMPPGLTQNADGFLQLEGDSWAFGFNAGLLVEFTPNTRLGVAYRSQVHHKVEGDAEYSNVPEALGSVFVDTEVTADVDLPASASASLYHRFNRYLAVMADVTWTQWSVFEELRFEFDSAQPDGVTTTNWNDSWRYSAGLTYNPTERWALRTGIAFDETPIPNAKRRTPRIPGDDRFWVAAGIGYRVLRWFDFDVGYVHIFIDDPKIDKDTGSPGDEDFFRGSLKGTYDASVDIFSAQVNFRF